MNEIKLLDNKFSIKIFEGHFSRESLCFARLSKKFRSLVFENPTKSLVHTRILTWKVLDQRDQTNIWSEIKVQTGEVRISEYKNGH